MRYDCIACNDEEYLEISQWVRTQKTVDMAVTGDVRGSLHSSSHLFFSSGSEMPDNPAHCYVAARGQTSSCERRLT